MKAPDARHAIVLAGCALSVLFVARSQIGGDQWNLLARGWTLVDQGVWIPFGNPTSAGGNGIGGLTSLVVGAPLFVWQHFRAPAVFIALLHLVAYILIDRALVQTIGPRGRVIFAVLYWLNPWRLYFSGHLWNPNFLFLAGAVHMSSSLSLRRRGHFWLSCLHVAMIGLAFQLHPAAIILALASTIGVARGTIRLHVAGASLGLAIVALSLLPWLQAVSVTPEILPGSEGFVGRGLVTVYPVVRGMLDLLRYPSLSVASLMTVFDFTTVAGSGVDRWLAPTARGVAIAVGLVSIMPALLAYRWFIRRQWHRRRQSGAAIAASGRGWCDEYCAACLAASILAFLAAPTTVMYWQSFVVLHVPVLVLVRWLTLLRRTRMAAVVQSGLAATGVASVMLALAMAGGSRHYRCGGREALGVVVADRYPMIAALGIDDACRVVVDPTSGWTPDVWRGRAR